MGKESEFITMSGTNAYFFNEMYIFSCYYVEMLKQKFEWYFTIIYLSLNWIYILNKYKFMRSGEQKWTKEEKTWCIVIICRVDSEAVHHLSQSSIINSKEKAINRL